MSASQRRYSREFREELCRDFDTSSRTIREVAEEYGVGVETLRTWLRRYRTAVAGQEETAEGPLAADERARLRQLERENRELRAEAAFLKKAAAYFAREPQ